MNIPVDYDSGIDERVTEKLEKIINETNMFNTSNVDMVNIYFFYCVNQSLEQYTKVVVPLKLGKLSKDDLLTNILKYRMNDGRRFNINGIYAYQFDTDVVDFIQNNECELKEHTQVEDIQFDPMIELYQHYSSIFIILNNEKTKHTRKIYDKVDKIDKGTKRKTSKII
jgi:uncharacterized sodium:solute symporter family permease YidK